LITDAPPLTFHQLYDGIFRELAAGHEGALPFRELPVAGRTAQPFDVLVRPGPRPMRDVASAGTIALRTLWIRARESRISLLDWRRQCHSGPPLHRIGPKDIDSTPVFPRDYSPGLPNFCYRDTGLGSWRWASQLPLGEAYAPQARGVYGLHRHVEYPAVADVMIETKVMDRCFLYAHYGNLSASTNASTVVFPTKPRSRVQLRPGNTSAIRSKRLLIGAFLSPMRVRNSSGSLHRLHRDKVLE